MATNCLGPLLLHRHLEKLLIQTSRSAGVEPGAVRLVWLSSFIAGSIKPGGMVLDSSGAPKILADLMANYLASKVGNVFIAHELAKRLGEYGIISMVWMYPSHRRVRGILTWE